MEANHSSESGTKTLKLPENEDRISALPDPLIHHILSFLPSTKQSIQTSILSKRWRNQWAHVPVLIFESESSGMSSDDDDVDFARFIDNTLLLYECSKMKKLHIAYDFAQDTNFNSKLRFAMRKDVEVLCLDSWHSGDNDHYRLPKFIFENASLVELQIYSCDFDLSCRINWSSLKALKIENCFLGVRLFIENVLSGSPSLGSLELENFNLNLQSDIVIASKSLKILILKSFELYNHIEISCPNIEELSLKSFNLEKCKLMNLPSSCCATLDFYIPSPLEEGCAKTLARKILKDLQAIKEVAVGNWFLELLSAIDMRKSSYPLLNIKCLTLDCHDLGHIVGIVNALRCSPALERLVLNVYRFQHRQTDDLDLNNFEEAYLDSNVTDFTCFMSNLKMVKIVGLSNYGDSKCQVVLQFLKFLLKNAKALEKMVVILDKDGGTDFLVKVSKKLLSFPRVSQHAIVELL